MEEREKREQLEELTSEQPEPTPEVEETPAAALSVEEDQAAESEVEDDEETPTADTAPELSTDVDEESPTSVDDSVETEKMLTQSQVNELVGRARQEGRESAMRELFSRYGVSGDEELNGIFGLGQAYHSLDDDFRAQGDSYRMALAENALLKSRADESRWDDIKYILGGRGLDVTVENIESLMPSHPEWRSQQQAQSEPVMVTREVVEEMKQQQRVEPEKKATVRRLGGEATPAVDNSVPMESEEERLRRLFGL